MNIKTHKHADKNSKNIFFEKKVLALQQVDD